MTWNWQHDDWPEFTWDEERLSRAEERFLVRGGVILGVVSHLDDDERDRLVVESLSEEALTTSEIEGETLRRASVQSSMRQELGLSADRVPATAAERGVAEMMVALHRSGTDDLEEKTLLSWHARLMRGRSELEAPGSYRTHEEPMQIVSRVFYEPRVHFEAPPSARVPDEMAEFLNWFNRTAPDGREPLPALTRAGIAHLYFESIHPFEDGNGRIGRAVAEKALAQGLGGPAYTALAATILRHRRAYYDVLEAANGGLELTEWLAWFGGVVLEAQERARAQVEFLIAKAKLLDRLRGELNDRQEKVLLRMLREGPDGFKGGLSAGNYTRIARTSPATARRDLADLVDKDALSRTGERRYTRYHLTIPTRRIPQISIDSNGQIVTDSSG